MATDSLKLDGFEPLALARTAEHAYCEAALRMQHNEFWWYYHGLIRPRHYWKPFTDRHDRWWFFVKPGFAWPVDFFKPFSDTERVVPRWLLLGWQYPVPEDNSDSQVWLNVIHDLANYDISRVASNKRRAVRKGFRNLKIDIIDPADEALGREACVVWNSHVERTGWNKPMGVEHFVQSWKELAAWPGTTVMTARDPAKGNELCGWLIGRVIDDTVYVDTIASHTDRLTNRPNDTIIFCCLASAAQMGIKHAHYSLKSKLTTLEAFKESLGFTAYPFPCRLQLHWPIAPALRLAQPRTYMRLLGDPIWSEEVSHPARAIFFTRPTTPPAEEVFRKLRETPPAPKPKAHPPRAETTVKAKPKEQDTSELARAWYVASTPPIRSSWIVYSLDFVLATLQGHITEPQNVRRTIPWLVVGSIVRTVMALAQIIFMILARLPIISWFVETLARTFTRNAAGFFLRSCYWKARLKHLGVNTLIDQGVDIWGPANVSIGSHCHIDTSARLAAGERRHRQKGSITIGSFVHIGPGVHIAGRGGVEIRDYVGIMANAHLYSATGVVERPDDFGQLISMSHMAPQDQQHVAEAPIIIDHYAFVGMMTSIMPGVKVGFGAVVHPNCVLTRDVPPFANIGGVPRGRQIGWRRPRRKSPRLEQKPSDEPPRHHPSDGDGEE